MRKLVLAVLLAWAGAVAWSQSAAIATKDMTEAEIRKIDKEARKVTLKHGPIKNISMPPMTMVFQVRDQALLDKLTKLAVGDKVKFSAELLQGAYVVTGLEKAGSP